MYLCVTIWGFYVSFFSFFFFLLPVALVFNVDISTKIVDGFHEGEYLDNIHNIKMYYAGEIGFPLLIHGAMDYVPALVADFLGGGNYTVIFTRLINLLVVAACWIIWLDFFRLAAKKNDNNFFWAFFFFFVFIFLTLPSGNTPILKQQAFLGTRDIFLLLSIWCAVVYSSSHQVFKASAFLFFCGFFAGVSVFWSYDRGLIGIIFVAVLVLFNIYRRRFSYSAVLSFGVACAILIGSLCGLFGSAYDNLGNIHYWVKNTGDVWRMSLGQKIFALPGAIFMLIFALFVMFIALKAAIKNIEKDISQVLLALICIQLVFLTKLYSLPGFPTTYYFIWPSVLLLLLAAPQAKSISSINGSLIRLWLTTYKYVFGNYAKSPCPWFLTVSILLFLVFSSNTLVTIVKAAKEVALPTEDKNLIDFNHYGLDKVIASPASCIFQWSNEGVFSFYAGKPYCTKYGYGVYISSTYEASVLSELKSKPPEVIVYDSPFWSANIYGRRMQDRLPEIDNFIRDNYLFHKTSSGYVIATLKINHSGGDK